MPVSSDLEDPGDLEATLPVIEGLAHLHEAVALLDADGRIAWVSDGLAALCGPRDELCGKPWMGLLAEQASAGSLIERLQFDGRLVNEPIELQAVDGSVVTARVSAARLGPCGERVPAVAILRVERDPVRSRQAGLPTLAAVLDGAPDGVVAVDESRFITYANRAIAELTGWQPEEIIDRPLALFVSSSEDLEHLAAALDADVENPVRDHDLVLRHREGHALPVSVSARQVELPDGTGLGTVAFVRDVSELRRSAEAVARKNVELEHTVRAVSHDLRSPLVSLLGFSRLLTDDFGEQLDERGRHFLSRIEQAGRTMEAMIHDLLQLARVGQNGKHDKMVDPHGVLRQLGAELKPRLDRDGVRLELPDDPPPVRCDRTRLYQIFSNLVGNALDHMGEVPQPVVRVEVRGRSHASEIVVRDNGRGIDPADHERIFEIFQSGKASRRAHGHTGMGLAIVKKIAESRGGSVEVESAPGRGAAFQVTLPH